MNEISIDKLRALADALGKVPDDTPDAAYFGLDMTHGQARGNLAAILAMAEDNERLSTLARANNDLARHEANGRRELQAENVRLREALERIDRMADGIDWVERSTLYRTVKNIARQALAAPGDGG